MAYTFAQLESFAIQGGFPANVAPIMAAIALAESSGVNQVQKGQPYSTTGWGLWQITPGNSVPQFGTDQALLNPVNNAQAAFVKWKGQGYGAWTTYTSGAYRQFLPANIPPPANDGSSGTAGGTSQGAPPPTSGAGFLSDVTGLTALEKGFEHFFDAVLNNGAYVLIVGTGVAMMGVGIVLMVSGQAPGVTGAVKKMGKLVAK